MSTCDYCKSNTPGTGASCQNCGAPLPNHSAVGVKGHARYEHGWTDWNAMYRVDEYGKVTCLENEK